MTAAPTRWRPRVAVQSPDPSHLWIKYRFRSWPGARDHWIDIASGGLGSAGERATSIESEWTAEPLDDLVYLPPVAREQRSARDELVRSLRGQGVPVLVQLLEEDPVGVGELAVYDLLETLLDRNFERLGGLPEGSSAVWPLIAGYTDGADLWHAGVERLASAGVINVQGVVAELDPSGRRKIVEKGGEQGFDALFHGSTPSEREFSQTVRGAGLNPFISRPLPEGPKWLRGNRRIAEVLGLSGEFWLRLGKQEATGQALYAAARRVDSDSHDLSTLCREGNLKVIDWLDPLSRQIIEEWVTNNKSSRLEELKTEYLAVSGETSELEDQETGN